MSKNHATKEISPAESASVDAPAAVTETAATASADPIDLARVRALELAIDHGRGLNQGADHIVQEAEKFYRWISREPAKS